MLRRLKQNLVGTRRPHRLSHICLWVFECLLWRYGSAVACCRGRVLVQQTWVWHKHSWKRLSLTHHRLARTYTRLGKQTLGGHKQNILHPRTYEKEAVTPKETNPDLPGGSRSLQCKLGLAVACCRVKGIKCSNVHWTFWGRLPLSSLPPP